MLGEDQILLKTETCICEGKVDGALLNLDARDAGQYGSSLWSSRRGKREGVDWLILHLLSSSTLLNRNAKEGFLSTLTVQLSFFHLPLDHLLPGLVWAPLPKLVCQQRDGICLKVGIVWVVVVLNGGVGCQTCLQRRMVET